MNKRYYLSLFTFAALLGAGYYFVNPTQFAEPESVSYVPKVKAKSHQVPDPSVHEDRPATPPSDEVEGTPNTEMTESSAPEWKELLEENLRAQGGDEVEEIKIDKIDSFKWKHDGISLNVDSVVITIRGKQNQQTKFRAIVDPRNGKILNSWDRPIVEYADPSKRRGIKVDPRYHQE